MGGLFRYHLLDKGNQSWLKREQLLDQISQMPEIKQPENIFQSVLTAEDQAALREFVDEFASRMTTALELKEYAVAIDALTQMHRLEIIGNSFVTNLIRAAEQQLLRHVVGVERHASASAMRDDFGNPHACHSTTAKALACRASRSIAA